MSLHYDHYLLLLKRVYRCWYQQPMLDRYFSGKGSVYLDADLITQDEREFLYHLAVSQPSMRAIERRICFILQHYRLPTGLRALCRLLIANKVTFLGPGETFKRRMMKVDFLEIVDMLYPEHEDDLQP